MKSRDPDYFLQLWRGSVTLREALAVDAELPVDTTEADLFLNTWAALVAGGSMRQFQRRLAWDGLTLEVAAKRIAVVAHAPVPQPEPAWLSFAREVLATESPDPAVDFARHGVKRLTLSRRFQPACASQVEAFILARLRAYPQGNLGPVVLRAMSEFTLRTIEAVNLMGQRADADWKHAGEVTELSFADSERLVCRLRFEGGRAAYYKPKSLDLDVALHGLIEWLRERERPCDWLPPAVEIVKRDGYGWMPEVKSGPPNPGYDRKAGGLLAILYLLEGRDFIADNVVANPVGPVVVDAETALQPRRRAAEDLDHTVLDSGLLPLWREGENVGGIQGGNADEICEGFRKGYDALLRHRGELALAARFAPCQGRTLFRDTEVYGRMLNQLSSPPCLRSGLWRGAAAESFLAPFIREAETCPATWELFMREMDFLDHWEIPFFPLKADACLLPGDQDTPLAMAERRLAQLDEADRARQESLIRAALRLKPRPRLKSSRETWLAEAAYLGEAVLESDLPEPFIYRGKAGRAVFLAALASATRDSKFADAARRDFQEIRQIQDGPAGYPDGLSSVVYALILGARFLDEPAWRDDAQALGLQNLERATSLDVIHGVAGAILALTAAKLDPGPGGDLLYAAAQRSADGQSYVWPDENGDPFLGFAHGSAGIAAALARAARLTGNADWKRKALDTGHWLAHLPPSGGLESWCQGLPGLLLSFQELRELDPQQPWIAPAIRSGVERLRALPLADSDDLCCGNFGRIGALIGLDREAAQWLLGKAWDRRESLGLWRVGERPSERYLLPAPFFKGLSGIGYTLLRLSDPDRFPCLLRPALP